MSLKRISRFLIVSLSLTALISSCSEKDDPVSKIENDNVSPIVEFTHGELAGLPGETLRLTATISDNLGIKHIKVESAEWEFVEEIPFSTQNYVKSYELSYSFTIPETAPRGSSADVVVIATDQAGNVTTSPTNVKVIEEPAKLEILQSMGFSIVIDGKEAQVNNNDVTFVDVADVKWTASMTLKSNRTKLARLQVVCPTLNVNDDIDLTNLPSEDEGKTVKFEKAYEIKGEADKHNFVFTLTDEKGSTATYSPTISVKATFAKVNRKQTKLFTLDTSIDLQKVVFGIPMLGEAKADESYKFTARYYADKPNTNVIFVSSRDRSATKYGISNDQKYIIASENPNPFVLPAVGYYEITVDLLLGTYQQKDIVPEGQKYPYTEEMYLAGGGCNGLGYDGNHPMEKIADTHRFRIAHNCNAEGGAIAFGIGGGVWLVAAGGNSDSDPEYWLQKPVPEGVHIYDTEIGSGWGNIEVVFDQFLYKAYAIEK